MDKLIVAASAADLSNAQELAQMASGWKIPVECVVLGRAPEDELARLLGQAGVSRVHQFDPAETEPTSQALATALGSVAGSAKVAWIAAASSPWMDALVARAAGSRGVVFDRVRDLTVQAGTARAVSEIFAGQFLKSSQSAPGQEWVAFVSAVASSNPAAAVSCQATTLPLAGGAEIRSRKANEASSGVSLQKAAVVLSLGDGVGRKGAAEARRIVAMAQELGVPMALGGTRVVTDAGVLPRHCQIGVSGISVSPKLLVSVGASGAPQHWAGIRDAQTILAVNTDSEAPLMSWVDAPVQGDGVEFLKSLRTRLWEILSPAQREALEARPQAGQAAPVANAGLPQMEESFTDQPLRVDFRSLEFDGFEVFRTHELDQAWTRPKLSALLRKVGRFAQTRLNEGKRNAEHIHCRMLQGEEHREHAIVTPPGLKEAFREYYQSGFGRFGLPRKFGGLETPHGFIDMVSEIVNAGSVAMGTSFELTMGASIVLRKFGNDWMKETVVPGLHDGRFQGTMCLTEAQAGSDLGVVATTAERIEGSDQFRVRGTKVFITAGDHDMSENVMHIVLARIKGVTQKGTGAISLFLVPKFELDEEGRSGEFNNVVTQGLEHKHGMTTSPTVSLKFEDAKGWLIARSVEEEMRQPTGLKSMFYFMNMMRHETGTAARGQAMATCLDVLEYNLVREQGVSPRDAAAKRKGSSPIFNHPSQRKVLMDMFARTLAGRAMTFHLTEIRDQAHHRLDHDLAEVAARRKALPLAEAQREAIVRAGAELSSLLARKAKGVAARKALAKDPDATAQNEAHIADVEARITVVRSEMDGICPDWLALDAQVEKIQARSRDDEAFALIFTSLVKAQVTDDNIRTLNEGMNACGGLGFMDESPVSQRLKDSQVLCIWEGTNDIQALNTVGRQIGTANKDSSGTSIWDRVMAEVEAILAQNAADPRLANAVKVLADQVGHLKEMRDVLCQATPAAKAEVASHLQELGLSEAEGQLRFQELVNATARQFSTWFSQVVEASQFLRSGRRASELLADGSSEWDNAFLEGRIALVRHFILSPSCMDKGLRYWRESFWNLIPLELDRSHLADQAERILA